MTSHVDADTLALSAEGLLDQDDESFVQEHVAQCEQCAKQSQDLAGVSHVLARAPAPAIPGSVVDRIDETLRTEIANNPGGGAQASHGPETDVANVTPLRKPGAAGRWMPYIAAAAAAIVLFSGGFVVFRGVIAANEDTHTAPNAATDGSTSEGSGGSDSGPGQLRIVESGTSYSMKGLDDEATATLAAAHGSEKKSEDESGSSLPSPADVPSTLSSCAQKLDQHRSGKRAELVDIATYQGTDAWVFFYGTKSGQDRQDTFAVVVISTGCDGAGRDNTPLAETTIPAP